MRQLFLSLLLSVFLVSSASAQLKGFGLQVFNIELPKPWLEAIGVDFVRAEFVPSEISETRIKRFLNHYSPLPVLVILQQKTPNAPKVAKDLERYGVKHLEIGNEWDLPYFNPGGSKWTPTKYGQWFKAIRKAVTRKITLYGPSLSHFTDDLYRKAKNAGMTPDVISLHTYGERDIPAYQERIAKTWRKPVMVSEVGPLEEWGDPLIYFHLWKQTLKTWVWYTSVSATPDHRALFTQVREHGPFEKATDLYERMKRSMVSDTTG